jgi:VWFA-related protein
MRVARQTLPSVPAATLLFCLCLGAYLAAGGVLRQFPPRNPQHPAQPTFRAEVELVQVDAIAVDAQGEPVRDLKREEFEVLEDGRPQQVATFEYVNVPVREHEGSQVFALGAPDVRSNVTDVTGRVYLLVLDDLRTAADNLMYGRRAASRFIREYMQPGDIGAVTFTSGRRNISQEFTADRRLLLAAVDRFMPFMAASGSAGDQAAPTGIAGVNAEQSGIRGVFSTLAALGHNLSRVRGGRKACVYFGPGFPVVQGSGSRALGPGEYRDLAAAANRSNITFYTIDPAGLTTLAEAAAATGSIVDPAAAVDALDASHEGLAWLAVDTGGFAVANSNNFDRAFERIRRETSSYYLLGYYPESPGKEGSIHRVAVKVRRPGVTVRARPGYSVPKQSERPSATLKTKNVPPNLLPALDSPLPSAAIRFSVAAAVFNGAGRAPRWASVVLEVNGADLDAGGKGALDVGVIAVDRMGAVKGHDVRRVDLEMDAASLERVRQAGLRVQARVPLEGDVRALRVAVADATRARVGSLSFDVDGTDFDKPAVSMSGVVLTDSRAGQVPTSNEDAELKRAAGGPASTRRQFAAADTIGWFAEVYQPMNRATDLRVTTSIMAADGSAVFRREEQRGPSEPRSPRRGIALVGRAPLAGFSPGAYVLRIEARAPGEKEPAAREVPFTVR